MEYLDEYEDVFGEPWYTNTIEINLYFINNSSESYEIIKTIFHEVRHAYQHESVLKKNNHIVNSKTIQWWAKNLPQGYEGFTGKDESEWYYNVAATAKYLGQPIEWDAKKFAKQEKEYTDYYDQYGTAIIPDYRGSW